MSKSEEADDAIRSGRVIRVFPRRTSMTPDDELAFVGDPPLFRPEAEAVHVSVTFTWDRKEGERLANAWRAFYPDVQLGGPAFNSPAGDFQSGRYLKEGVIITSRGCPADCWFCYVPRREGPLLTLPIREGNIVQDNNLLACPDSHIRAVIAMLARQERAARFVGGLDVFRFNRPIADLFDSLAKPPEFWFSYDRISQLAALRNAVSLVKRHKGDIRCYVLIGYSGDTFDYAEKRCADVLATGAMPFAMLYHDDDGRPKSLAWRRLQRLLCRPATMRRPIVNPPAVSGEQ